MIAGKLNEIPYLNDFVSRLETDNLNYLVNLKVNNVLVTLGSYGSVLVKDEQCQYFPSIKVHAIDTTGAGDLMNACLAYGLQNMMSLEEAVRLGTKACAHSVTKRFVLDSYPTLLDINKIQ